MIYRTVLDFLTDCRLFATLKILVILLVADLTSNAKNYFL